MSIPVILHDCEPGIEPYLRGRATAALTVGWSRAPAREHAAVAAAVDVVLDTPGSIVRARQFLRGCVKSGHVAVSRQGGDDETYKIAVEIQRDLGLSPEKALELMAEEFNPHCIPPWPIEE